MNPEITLAYLRQLIRDSIAVGSNEQLMYSEIDLVYEQKYGDYYFFLYEYELSHALRQGFDKTNQVLKIIPPYFRQAICQKLAQKYEEAIKLKYIHFSIDKKLKQQQLRLPEQEQSKLQQKIDKNQESLDKYSDRLELLNKLANDKGSFLNITYHLRDSDPFYHECLTLPHRPKYSDGVFKEIISKITRYCEIYKKLHHQERPVEPEKIECLEFLIQKSFFQYHIFNLGLEQQESHTPGYKNKQRNIHSEFLRIHHSFDELKADLSLKPDVDGASSSAAVPLNGENEELTGDL